MRLSLLRYAHTKSPRNLNRYVNVKGGFIDSLSVGKSGADGGLNLIPSCLLQVTHSSDSFSRLPDRVTLKIVLAE